MPSFARNSPIGDTRVAAGTMHSTTILELAQFATNLLGLVITTWAVGDAWATWETVERFHVRNGRRLIAQNHRRNEQARWVAQACLTLMAAVSLFLLPAPPPYMNAWYLRYILARKALATVVSMVLCWTSVQDANTRRILALEGEEDDGAAK